MLNTKFVWVRHYEPASLERVEQSLARFRPQLIGIELDDARLKKLLHYKKKQNSEFYAAYSYAKEKRIPLVLLDKGHSIDALARRLSLLTYMRLLVLFTLKNLFRLLLMKPFRKLKVRDSALIEGYILKERDELFVARIRELAAQNKGKRILLIFGRAHRQGILKGLHIQQKETQNLQMPKMEI